MLKVAKVLNVAVFTNVEHICILRKNKKMLVWPFCSEVATQQIASSAQKCRKFEKKDAQVVEVVR